MCVSNVFCTNNKTGGKGKMKKKEKTVNKVLRVVERVIRNKAEKLVVGDPPVCFGIIHQPKRPKRKVD